MHTTSTPAAAFNFLTHAAILQSYQHQSNLLRQSLPPSCFISSNLPASALGSHGHSLPSPASLSLPVIPISPALTNMAAKNHPGSNQSLCRREVKQQEVTSPQVPNPFLSYMYYSDSVVGEFEETRLENKMIYAFSIGGEKRLCLPQVLNNVLFPHTTLQEINQVCEDLHIFCKRCNAQQMRILKERNVFGPNLENCGLITKSDAERLCKVLLHRNLQKYNNVINGDDGIAVYHNCFGKQRGFLLPHLYAAPEAACIVCDNCSSLLSPTQFVGHAHNRPEKRTCHWGFDTARWRNYIMLEQGTTRNDFERNQLEKVLEKLKTKFDRKRQQILNTMHDEVKRHKPDENEDKNSTANFESSNNFIPPPPSIITSGSATCPMPRNLRQGSPILLNPERIVPQGEGNCSDPAFAPNVRLAPLPRKKQTIDAEYDGRHNSETEKPAAAISSAGIFHEEWDALLTLSNRAFGNEEATHFHSMVEKIRRSYELHISQLEEERDCKKLEMEMQERKRRQLEAELQKTKRQIEEQQTPDVRKMKMKYTAQKEEIRVLEADRERLLSEIAQLSSQVSKSPCSSKFSSQEDSVNSTGAASDENVIEICSTSRPEEDGPPSLEPCVS